MVLGGGGSHPNNAGNPARDYPNGLNGPNNPPANNNNQLAHMDGNW